MSHILGQDMKSPILKTADETTFCLVKAIAQHTGLWYMNMKQWWGDNQPSKNEAAQRKVCSTATLSTTTVIWNHPGFKLTLSDKKPLPQYLAWARNYSKKLYTIFWIILLLVQQHVHSIAARFKCWQFTDLLRIWNYQFRLLQYFSSKCIMIHSLLYIEIWMKVHEIKLYNNMLLIR